MRHLNTPSLAIARQSLRDAMCRCGWPPSVIFDAELALAELLVNAWRHGETPAPVVLILAVGPTLRVSVSDESPGLPEKQQPALLAQAGRGLQLVEGLTHRWGVDPQERGKMVWFELDAA
ncbi:serine/threonine-protein kinase RsbW [Kitasatospora sp. MAA19]|uniref:ATP-binding protein n=1 Tax=unclassified Kitasatospora TaxID=2633591 RepID=UPI002473733D|nr:ATP-binding protein [Kitasatospora sp. MAA19]MDH6704205.1 serine/threonine-protein kinase RsbW [Kitasatospora sp. MAA19]